MKCRLCDYEDSDATTGARCPVHETLLVDATVLSKYAQDILLGQIVGDEFGLVDVLGVGGFGTVYRAIQFPIRRPVALKVLHPQFYFDAGIRQRFYQEARAIGSLTDTTVVKLIRFGEQQPGTLMEGSPGFFFMAQEFIEGETLHKAIRRDGRFDAPRAIHIGIQILRALADAHRYGIVHRDLKPANIMLTEDALGDETVKVLDFGIAKVFDEGGEDDAETPVTMTGIMLGTPNYMSPEQIQNVNIQPATDLYAVGVILYELLTGIRPFQRANRRATLMAQRMDNAPPFPPDVTAPASVYAVIEKALSKEAEARFQSAKSMADALRVARQASVGAQADDTLQSSNEAIHGFSAPPQPTQPDGAAYDLAPVSAKVVGSLAAKSGFGPIPGAEDSRPATPTPSPSVDMSGRERTPAESQIDGVSIHQEIDGAVQSNLMVPAAVDTRDTHTGGRGKMMAFMGIVLLVLGAAMTHFYHAETDDLSRPSSLRAEPKVTAPPRKTIRPAPAASAPTTGPNVTSTTPTSPPETPTPRVASTPESTGDAGLTDTPDRENDAFKPSPKQPNRKTRTKTRLKTSRTANKPKSPASRRRMPRQKVKRKRITETRPAPVPTPTPKSKPKSTSPAPSVMTEL
ncbi:MAG: protein kinase [Myxococcota bacterium]|nr:protein kinase [Myxococcota bacterium]